MVGAIHVVPFNRSRSTWQVKWVTSTNLAVGSQLLRYALETVLEARTWVLEIPIQERDTLALYRQNGFQPLAHCTYWHLHGSALTALAHAPVEAPTLSPVGNGDAYLRYQLDTLAMPPLVRQVFDRHPEDFAVPLWQTLWHQWRTWQGQSRWIRNYVFEPQRKAAIGYFGLWFDPPRPATPPGGFDRPPRLYLAVPPVTFPLDPPGTARARVAFGLHGLSTGAGSLFPVGGSRAPGGNPVDVPFRVAQTAGG
jgi:hypothetical protein